MSTRPTLAIAGATGNLGYKLAQSILLPEFKANFTKVIILSRSESDKTRQLVSCGAEMQVYEDNVESIMAAIAGADVLVSTVGPSGHAFKDKLLEAMAGSSVKLYFPSEFGVDHTLHDFRQEEWDAKKHHFDLTKLRIPDIKVVRVFPGLFIDDSIGPWYGMHTKQGRYEAVGDPATRTSYTSMEDVGRYLAVLAARPLGEIPDAIHLSGDSKSFHEIAEIMERHGAGPIEVCSAPLNTYKAKTLDQNTSHLECYIRFVMGEGKLDQSVGAIGNDNDLVNPGQKLWKWKTIEDVAKETGGKPWSDYDW